VNRNCCADVCGGNESWCGFRGGTTVVYRGFAGFCSELLFYVDEIFPVRRSQIRRQQHLHIGVNRRENCPKQIVVRYENVVGRDIQRHR
jgi:hypothetical protein